MQLIRITCSSGKFYVHDTPPAAGYCSTGIEAINKRRDTRPFTCINLLLNNNYNINDTMIYFHESFIGNGAQNMVLFDQQVQVLSVLDPHFLGKNSVFLEIKENNNFTLLLCQ